MENTPKKNEDKPGAFLGPVVKDVFGMAIPMGYREVMAGGWLNVFRFDEIKPAYHKGVQNGAES